MGIKKTILPLVATAILVGAMFFAGCEKETLLNNDTLVNNYTQNITKCWGEDDQDGDIYYSTPDNPNVLIRERDGSVVTVESIYLGELCGSAYWLGRTFVCRGEGDTCGNCYELNEQGEIVNSGSYTHSYDPEGRVVATYYNWNDCHQDS